MTKVSRVSRCHRAGQEKSDTTDVTGGGAFRGDGVGPVKDWLGSSLSLEDDRPPLLRYLFPDGWLALLGSAGLAEPLVFCSLFFYLSRATETIQPITVHPKKRRSRANAALRPEQPDSCEELLRDRRPSALAE